MLEAAACIRRGYRFLRRFLRDPPLPAGWSGAPPTAWSSPDSESPSRCGRTSPHASVYAREPHPSHALRGAVFDPSLIALGREETKPHAAGTGHTEGRNPEGGIAREKAVGTACQDGDRDGQIDHPLKQRSECPEQEPIRGDRVGESKGNPPAQPRMMGECFERRPTHPDHPRHEGDPEPGFRKSCGAESEVGRQHFSGPAHNECEGRRRDERRRPAARGREDLPCEEQIDEDGDRVQEIRRAPEPDSGGRRCADGRK